MINFRICLSVLVLMWCEPLILNACNALVHHICSLLDSTNSLDFQLWKCIGKNGQNDSWTTTAWNGFISNTKYFMSRNFREINAISHVLICMLMCCYQSERPVYCAILTQVLWQRGLLVFCGLTTFIQGKLGRSYKTVIKLSLFCGIC